MKNELISFALPEYGVQEIQGGAAYHVVNLGDTLYRLSIKYGTEVDQIRKWNSLTGNNIFIGQQLRVSEKDGYHEPRILEYAKESGFDVVDDETAWCSIFINWCAIKAGLKRSGAKDARSWLKTGKSTNFENAHIVVYWRESKESWKGHVGIPVSFNKDKSVIYTLGGNQSNMVCIKGYGSDRFLDFRNLY